MRPMVPLPELDIGELLKDAAACAARNRAFAAEFERIVLGPLPAWKRIACAAALPCLVHLCRNRHVPYMRVELLEELRCRQARKAARRDGAPPEGDRTA